MPSPLGSIGYAYVELAERPREKSETKRKKKEGKEDVWQRDSCLSSTMSIGNFI